MSTEATRCEWCSKDRKSFSGWEQKTLSGDWRRLCSACANRRIRNPYNALLQMRKIELRWRCEHRG